MTLRLVGLALALACVALNIAVRNWSAVMGWSAAALWCFSSVMVSDR